MVFVINVHNIFLINMKGMIMKSISIGIMIGVLICTIILSFYPLVETTQACSKCGSEAWYFKIIEH